VKQLNKQEITACAERLNDALKVWRIYEQKGDYVVFRVPEKRAPDSSSPVEGETMTFWRFDGRFAAERFRNSCVINELLDFIAKAAARAEAA
jgi:hypothetical protein